MLNDTYMIICSWMTADASVEGIRQTDPNDSIGLISAEPPRPYDRPPLSKGLWKGKPLESIWRKATDQGVNLHLGRRACPSTFRPSGSPMTRGPFIPTISCSWPREAPPDGSPSAAIGSSTSASSTITSAFARWRSEANGSRSSAAGSSARRPSPARFDRRTSKAGCRPETPAGAAYSTHEPTSKAWRTSWRRFT